MSHNTQKVFVMQSYKGKDGGGTCLLPPVFGEIKEKVLGAHVREDDVWLASFPRTGSTWCQEMIWLIRNNSNFEKAQTTLQQIRAPLIEAPIALYEYVDFVGTLSSGISVPRYTQMNIPFELLTSSSDNVKCQLAALFSDSVGFVEQLPSPRCIKTHLTIDLLPEKIKTVKPKIIYTLRNPKDICVSYYFHCQMVHKITFTFDDFCELFMNGLLPIGSLFNHYLGYWNKRHELDILILRYEDMKNDTRGTVKKIAQYLNKSLTDEDVDAICEFLSFQNMRENKACNLQVLLEIRGGNDFYKKTGKHFIRKGIVGDHKNYMSPEMIEKFDKWIEKQTENTDLKF